jgi:peptidoglycan/LPS O-acetylase OafA/YrhL
LTMAGKVGAHSYSIYLWHMPILLWSAPYIASDADGGTCTLFLAANILVILAVGVLLSLAVETPFLRLRDWCCPRGFANIKAP